MTRPCWETDLARNSVFLLAMGVAAGGTTGAVWAYPGHDLDNQISHYEASGDLPSARALLEREASASGDTSAAAALAQFLERHGDPGSRDAYLKWAAEESDAAKRKLALRQAVLLDFMAGKSDQLASDLSQYRAAGGTDFTAPAKKPVHRPFSTIAIPGPLASFARMAALSTDLSPEDLLPALARNVVTSGYEASANEALEQTEYLRLLIRYIGQARELQAMAGGAQKIVIPACDSAETGNLLKILGYRMRGSCGADIVLETVNPTRAFLTIDSAFPLTKLEQDLRANRRFELPFAPTQIPVLYDGSYWVNALGRAGSADFLDAFLSDPSLCRLYLGLSRLDYSTAEALRGAASPARLKVYAHVLDFFGSMFQIRNGAAVVPGSAAVWTSLVGVSPANPGAFFAKLIATDDGWLASYFDALSRASGPTADYLTQSDRMKRFYEALRGKITSPGPARPVFRSSTELLLLTTTLRIDPNGRPHVPGDLNVWRTLFIKHPHGKYDGRLTRSANTWRTSDDLVEALFGLSRKMVENEPLRIFLALDDIDRNRKNPISPELATRLVGAYRAYGAQYILFADAPGLSEASIERYLALCGAISSTHDSLLKADAAGTLQALVEIWRILCRQNAISDSAQEATFAKLIDPFTRIKQESDLFDAGRSGLKTLFSAANAPAEASQQLRLVTLLEGKVRGSDKLPYSPAENFLRIYDAQRLVPLDTLFAVADHAGASSVDPKLLKNINEQAGRMAEPESLRASLSTDEKTSLAAGYWSDRHIDHERKVNWETLLKSPENKDVRGVLAPFLRDSLVGVLYCYYAPAGAQLLLANPLFVRSHDFIGSQGSPAEWRVAEVSGTGWPASGGGRLSGSLISLPYTLAEAEQNFLTPKRQQALIWGDLVPQMIVDVTITRWRNVTPEQLRWVGLRMARGRTLLAAAALDPSLEPRVLDALARFAIPARVAFVRDSLRAGDFARAVGQIPPSEIYAIGSDPSLREVAPDLISIAIENMANEHRPELAPQAIARAFGTPKPTLTHSYRPNLLYLRTFPTLMGYSSRVLAETWESNNLYYAALADETGVAVDELDSEVPEWNRAAIEDIFATHLEDWPALLRSLHTVASNVRQHAAQHGSANSAEY